MDNYIPMDLKRMVEASQLNPYLKNNILTESLTFKNPKHSLKLKSESFEMYATQFKKRTDGKYIAIGWRCSPQEILQCPLSEFLSLSETYSPAEFKIADQIKETDAVIYQLFGRYPKLLNFLFPGLAEYHEGRSDDTYKTCMQHR